MQTKKKNSGRNASREHASAKASRPQKKITEKVQGPEKKVTELITSSVRKQKLGMLLILSPYFVFWLKGKHCNDNHLCVGLDFAIIKIFQ